MLVSDAEP